MITNIEKKLKDNKMEKIKERAEDRVDMAITMAQDHVRSVVEGSNYPDKDGKLEPMSTEDSKYLYTQLVPLYLKALHDIQTEDMALSNHLMLSI